MQILSLDRSNTATVNLQRMDHFWFQQDCIPPHTARATIDVVKPLFPGCLILKIGDFDWPSHSLDLIPPVFYLWRYWKSKLYINKTKTLAELKANRSTGRNHGKCRNPSTLGIRPQGDHLHDIIFRKSCNQNSLNQVKWFFLINRSWCCQTLSLDV